MKNTLILSAIFILSQQYLYANNASGHMDGAKFFVVFGVLATILIGVFILLIYLERKISNLERFLKNK